MAENNLKEESPKFYAGDGGKKNEAKKVIKKKCHIQGTSVQISLLEKL